MAEPGISRFAKIQEQKAKLLNIADTESEENIPKVENINKIEKVEKVVKEKQSNEEKTVTLKQSEFEKLQEQILKKVTESIDPHIYKRHPKYKGPRVARTFHLEMKIDAWLNNIYDSKRIEKTEILSQALKDYLQKNYLECEPEQE